MNKIIKDCDKFSSYPQNQKKISAKTSSTEKSKKLTIHTTNSRQNSKQIKNYKLRLCNETREKSRSKQKDDNVLQVKCNQICGQPKYLNKNESIFELQIDSLSQLGDSNIVLNSNQEARKVKYRSHGKPYSKQPANLPSTPINKILQLNLQEQRKRPKGIEPVSSRIGYKNQSIYFGNQISTQPSFFSSKNH